MHVLGFPADESLIDFDLTGERQHVTFHRGAPSVTHEPASAVIGAGILAEDDAVNLESADSLLAGQDQEGDLEPECQRNLGVLKNGVRDDAKFVAIATAAIVVSAAPSERLASDGVDLLFPVAARAAHAIGPAVSHEKGFAVLVSPKAPIEGGDGFHESNIA